MNEFELALEKAFAESKCSKILLNFGVMKEEEFIELSSIKLDTYEDDWNLNEQQKVLLENLLKVAQQIPAGETKYVQSGLITLKFVHVA